MQIAFRCCFLALAFGLTVALSSVPTPPSAATLCAAEIPARPEVVLECPEQSFALLTLPGLPGVLVLVPVEARVLAHFEGAEPAYAVMGNDGQLVPLDFAPDIAPLVLHCGALP